MYSPIMVWIASHGKARKRRIRDHENWQDQCDLVQCAVGRVLARHCSEAASRLKANSSRTTISSDRDCLVFVCCYFRVEPGEPARDFFAGER